MKEFWKYIFLILGIIAGVFAIVRGSIQPFIKSETFINALQNIQNIKTLDEFTRSFDDAFNLPSPIGNEELAKFLSDDVSGLISQNTQPENVSRILESYMESHMSQSDIISILNIAHFHTILFQRFHNVEDYNLAEQAYLKGLAIAPKLTPVLYGLVSLYASVGDQKKLAQIAQTISLYWPDDEQIQNALRILNSPTPVAPVAK